VNQKDYNWLSPYSVKGTSTAGKRPTEPFKVELKVSETIPAATSNLETRVNRDVEFTKATGRGAFNLSSVAVDVNTK